MVSSTLFASISFASAAYLHSTGGSLRSLLIAAAGLSFSIIPFTVYTLLPVNNELGSMLDSGSLKSEEANPSEVTPQQKRAVGLLAKWQKLHRVRMVLGGSAWVAGLVALLLHP